MAQANLNANIGIGTIELKLSKTIFGNVELVSGVGETSVSGADYIEKKSALVSSNLKAQGE